MADPWVVNRFHLGAASMADPLDAPERGTTNFFPMHSVVLTTRSNPSCELCNLFDTSLVDRTESVARADRIYAHQRLPTDAVYNANVLLQNVVVGSAYWLGESGDSSVVLASGTVTIAGKSDGEVGDFTIENVNAYGTPYLIELRLRKGTSGDKYQPFKIFANHNPLGISIYCSQIPDNIA